MITGSERMVIAGDQYEGEQTKEGKTLPKQWRAIFNAGYRAAASPESVATVRVRAATTEANLTDNPGYDVTSEFLPPTAAQTIAYLEGEVARLRELLGLPGTSREDVC